MKIQSFAIIAIIIILPLTLVLDVYTQAMLRVVELQTQYDTKLLNATYDSLQTMALNYEANPNSDILTSRIEDIEAAINSFYNSMAYQFSGMGLTKRTIQSYVPAILYTSYDGYYIYSPYENVLFESSSNDKYMQGPGVTFPDILTTNKITPGIAQDDYDDSLYRQGETIFGLKPLAYYAQIYSSRNYIVIVNYTLDSYITLTVIDKNNQKMVRQSGYLFDESNLTKTSSANSNYSYKGFPISAGEGSIEYVAYKSYDENEILAQIESEIGSGIYSDYKMPDTYTAPSTVPLTRIIKVLGNTPTYIGEKVVTSAIKLNGKLKYLEESTDGPDNVWSYTSSSSITTENKDNQLYKNYNKRYGYAENDNTMITNNKSADNFCTDAMNFRCFLKHQTRDTLNNVIEYNDVDVSAALRHVYVSDAKKYVNSSDSIPYSSNLSLYDLFFCENVEDEDSEFSQHKSEVMKYLIQEDLNNVISNYGKLEDVGESTSSVSNEYIMPKIIEEDWDRITTTVSMTTFLQGFNLGRKAYNSYCTLTNTYTKEFIAPNSIKLVMNKDISDSGEPASNAKYYYNFFDKKGVEQFKTLSSSAQNNVVGILNVDLVGQKFTRSVGVSTLSGEATSIDVTLDMYSRPEYKSYTFEANENFTYDSSGLNGRHSIDNIPKYIEKLNNKKLGSVYFTALFREKQGMYRVNNPLLAVDSSSQYIT